MGAIKLLWFLWAMWIYLVFFKKKKKRKLSSHFTTCMSYRKDYCGSQVKTRVLVEVSNRKYRDKMPPESWRPVHFPSKT